LGEKKNAYKASVGRPKDMTWKV